MARLFYNLILQYRTSFSFNFRLWQRASQEIQKARNTTCRSTAGVRSSMNSMCSMLSGRKLASIIIMSTCAPAKFQGQSTVLLHIHICSTTLSEARRNDVGIDQKHKHLLHWLKYVLQYHHHMCHRLRGKNHMARLFYDLVLRYGGFNFGLCEGLVKRLNIPVQGRMLPTGPLLE